MPETDLLVLSNRDQNAVSNKVEPGEGGIPDTVSAWAELYFLTEVTTGERSRKEQARDFRLFLAFLRDEIGCEERERWTPRVSREFIDYLRSQLREDGQRRFADRTVNRIVAHLKTFSKWIHRRRPFPDQEHPLQKIRALAEDGKLEDRARPHGGRAPAPSMPPTTCPSWAAGPATAAATGTSSSPTSGPGVRATGPGGTGRSSTA